MAERRINGASPDGRVLWLDRAAGAPNSQSEPPLRGDADADICIVGGGFLGLWTALAILELKPGTDVCVLEASTCGFGASGRNAGFAMSIWSKAASLVGRTDSEEAARLARSSDDAIDEIQHFCRDEQIDCDFQMPGWVWAATAPAQVGSWRSTLAAVESLGGAAQFHELSSGELRGRLGTTNVYGGVLEPHCATVDPGKLVAGVKAAALRRGARIYEQTPVLEIDRRTQMVRCAGGSVRPRQLVLATNAWLAKLPELRRVIVPVSADVIATNPLPDFFTSSWTGGEALTNSSMIADFARPTADHRVVIGRGGAAMAFAGHLGRGFLSNPPRTKEIATALALLFPATEKAGVTHSWSGPVDRTFDGLPIIDRLPNSRILFGGGFSGNGVGPSRIFGRMLASLALEIDDEWSTSSYIGTPEYRFPPEPLRYIGGALVRRAVRDQIVETDAGRPISALTRKLVSYFPSGLMKVES